MDREDEFISPEDFKSQCQQLGINVSDELVGTFLKTFGTSHGGARDAIGEVERKPTDNDRKINITAFRAYLGLDAEKPRDPVLSLSNFFGSPRTKASAPQKKGKGDTLVHAAARRGDNAACAKALDSDKDLLNSRNSKRGTPLHLAGTQSSHPLHDHMMHCCDAVCPFLTIAMNGHADTCLLLLKRGAATNARAEGGKTPLHMAAQNGHRAALLVLLEHNADVDALSDTHSTPLLVAAARGQAGLITVLLEHGADVEARLSKKGPKGQQISGTALHVAAQNGHADTCKVLLKAGAEVDPRDGLNATPLIHAAYRGHEDCCLVLTARGADLGASTNQATTAMTAAVDQGHTAMALMYVGNPLLHFLSSSAS
jgi:cytohesin